MKSIPLTRGMVAIVDDSDYEFLSRWKWNALTGKSGKFYAVRTERIGKRRCCVLMHRVIAGAVDEEEVDHRDRCTLNNQRSNLRICTRSQNVQNAGVRSDNRSGFKGVYPCYGKWRSQIRLNGKPKYLGSFPTAFQAALAYDSAAVERFGEFALTNRGLGLIK